MYSILLWLGTGWLLLKWDVPTYRKEKLEKEKKTARITGWFNLVTGLLLMIWNWIS